MTMDAKSYDKTVFLGNAAMSNNQGLIEGETRTGDENVVTCDKNTT